MNSFLDRIKQRKLFQWAFAYVAGAWLVIQVVDVLGDQFLWSLGLQRGITAVLAVGFPVALVLAWYHGEKGRQRVSGPEFVILTSLMLLAGVALAVFNPFEEIESVDGGSVAMAFNANSIVVLPFLDMSADGDQEYMSDGIAEELLNLLAKIPELTVISRTSAFSFKGRDDITIPEIAALLGVAHVLEGSVRKAGNTIRITAQLIDTRTDTHLFSETYDRVLDDIFAIQDEIAANVVSKLRITLLGELPTLQETDPEAYALFLQARHVKNNGDLSAEHHATSIAMFERVRDLAPDYAPTYAELAVLYANQAAHGYQAPEERLQMARDAAERGLALDPDLVYAVAMLGWASMVEGDLEGAVRHIERAMEMDPHHPDVLMNVGLLLHNLGRSDEAIAFFEYVRDRDPVYQVNLFNLAGVYIAAGRWEDAISTIRTLGSLEPSYLGGLAYIYYYEGRWEEAISTGRTMSERGLSSPEMHGSVSLSMLQMGDFEGALAEAELEPEPWLRFHCLALANYALGRQAEFERAFDESKSLSGEIGPELIAAAYAYMGDADAAFEWLQDVSPAVPGWGGRLDPLYANVHDDPRWAAWLEKEPDDSEAISFEPRLPR